MKTKPYVQASLAAAKLGAGVFGLVASLSCRETQESWSSESSQPSAVGSTVGTSSFDTATQPENSSGYWKDLPASLDPPPQGQDLRPEQVALGRALFFSTQLSKSKDRSCASCHDPKHAFADPRRVPTALDQSPLLRNSPSLLNTGWATYLTWSNLALNDHATQAMVPLFGDSPPEMGASFDPNWLQERLAQDAAVLEAIAQDPGVAGLASLNWELVLRRLADFQRSLVSLDAPWDRFQAGDPTAISDSAKRGEALFFSSTLACSSCHPPPLFSSAFRSRGQIPSVQESFFNTGLYFLNDAGRHYPEEDPGLMEFTGKIEDEGKFRVPSLRNLAQTAPYMHDGSINTLTEVIAHYARGGRKIESGPHRGDGSQNPYKDPRIRGFPLTPQERDDLLAFLLSLSEARFGAGLR